MDCGHGWRNDNDCDVCRPPAVVVAGLRGRIAELEAMVRELTMDLENEVDGRYGGRLEQPVMRRRYERDIEPCRRARELLGDDKPTT